jgi:hypothetical protein
MRAFLGLAALSLGVIGPLPDIQPVITHIQAPAPPQIVLRSGKGDRQPLFAADRPVHATPRTGAQLDSAEMFVGSDQTVDDVANAAADTTADEPAEGEPAAGDNVAAESDAAAALPRAISADELCEAVLSSAQANDLPLAFFSNLIWQESRFDVRSVSHAGAQGIAQFMPATAARNGLGDPFDPFQALPASARLLRQLRDQFGNIGLAAAAYNAGPGRVSTFLKSGRLPRETRAYVRIITGRPAEEWRGLKEADAVKLTPRLPCRQMPVFADLDVARAEAAQSDPSDLAKTVKDEARLPAPHRGPSFSPSALRAAKGRLVGRLAGRVARRVASSVKVARAGGGKAGPKEAQKSAKARTAAHGTPHRAVKNTTAHGKHRTA